MRLYSVGQLSNSEKSDILGKHREVYNGYKRMHPEVSNEQPLYTQDFAGDKNGLTVNNKGEVKHYMNVGINEGWESLAAGAIATELAGPFAPVVAPAIEDKITDITSLFSSPTESTEGEMEEETEEGIYDVEDLNPENKFDYTEEDVEYEPMESAFSDELDEISGPSPLYSEVDFPAYDFKSEGPMFAPHGVKEDEIDEIDLDKLEKGKKYKYKTPSFDDELEFENDVNYSTGEKHYAFKGDKGHGHLMGGKHIEDFMSDIDEQRDEDDLDFGDKDTAFSRMKRGKGDIEDIDWEDITDDSETAFSRMKRGKGDIEDIDWEEVDEDLKESFVSQKNKITEMFNRMNKYN